MKTKKALKKELEALKKELAETKRELEAAKISANSVHLYREHCVQEWFACEEEVKRLTIENANLRMENRRLMMGSAAVKAVEAARTYYNAQKVNEMEVQ